MEQMRESILAGDIATVQRQVQAYVDIGVTHVITMVNFGGTPMSDVRRTLELMSKEVFPQFQ